MSICCTPDPLSDHRPKDWWLTPELYLRRPPAYFPEWRLDRLLKKKAEQGVKIHVVVYKEVNMTLHFLPIRIFTPVLPGHANNVYGFQAHQGIPHFLMNLKGSHLSTQNYLESLHPNITVMRHPDHIGTKGTYVFCMSLLTFRP